MKEKKKKKIHPIPHDQRNIFWKKKPPNLPTLKNIQTSPSYATQKHNPLK
jgi:hypothetical protein